MSVRTENDPHRRNPTYVPRPRLSQSRLYDRNFVLAMASQGCFVIANTLMAHYARWIEFLGGRVGEVGWVMGAGAVAGLLLRPWMGQWINRLGPRATWLVGLAVFAFGSIGNLALDDLSAMLYVLRSCLVLGTAIVFASSLTYISQIAPPARRTEAIGIIGVGGFLGMLLGPVLGDLILAADVRQRIDFVTLFGTAGLGILFPAVLVCFLRAPAGRNRNSSLRLRDFVRTMRVHWPGMILFVDLAFGVCMAVPFGFLASYIDQVPLRIPGMSVIGLFFWCYAGSGLTVRVVLRRVPELLGRRKVLLAGMLFMTIGFFCYLLVGAENPWIIVIPALLTGTGHGLAFHTMTSLSIESFPSDARGTGSALALMMMDVGMIAGAPILGQIAEAFGFHSMYAAIGVIMLVAAVAYAWSSIPVWQAQIQQHADRDTNRKGEFLTPPGDF